MKLHLALAGALVACAPFTCALGQDSSSPVADGASAPATATAPPDSSRYGGLGLKFGLDGFGLNYVYGLNRYVGLRAGYNAGSYSYNDDEDGTAYKAKLKLNAVSGFVDFMPFGGGFRVSVGLYGKTPELTLDAHGEDQYEFGDGTYNGDLVVHGQTDLGGASPYVGFGWGGTANATGFGVSFDIGAIIGKKPKLGLAASGVACDAGANPSCDPHGEEGFDVSENAEFQANLEAERQKLEDDAKDFRFWPVINLGVFYRF